MKNILVALIASVLFMIVLCAKNFSEPPVEKNILSEDEVQLLMISLADVIYYVEGKSPIQRITFFIDGKNGDVRLNVKVDDSTSEEKRANIENELKREIFHAIIDNSELENNDIFHFERIRLDVKIFFGH